MRSTTVNPIVIAPPPALVTDSVVFGEPIAKPNFSQPQLALQFSPMANHPAQSTGSEIEVSSALRIGQRDPAVWAAQLVAGILEVLAGARSVSQLAMLLSPEVYAVINAHAQRLAALTPRHRPLVRSVRVCMPTDEIAEAAVIIQGAKRSRAIALRLEVQHGRWRATAIVFG
jgi:hypothetical protein